MSDLEDAVAEFLAEAEDAIGEYEQGYLDPDTALDRVAAAVRRLREQAEE